MAHVHPRPREELAELEPMFQGSEAMFGFVPNSFFTMAHRPDILRGYYQLASAIMMKGSVDTRLKRMCALVASTSAGCRYCQAHMATFSALLGGADQVEQVWDFEASGRFTEAERAALRLAREAGQVPNGVTAEHFEQLRRHFDDGQIVEIVGAVALFGYLNRWNDTMATDLEDVPLKVASETLGPQGWEPGKHRV